MSDAATIPTRSPRRPFRSKRLLALAGDDRLVEQMRRGNEAAFEVAFERHGAGILGFSRHMLGSPEEAEDVVQHTFAAAYRDLQRRGGRSIALKPWLYTIARNRCLSLLRARREEAAELHDVPTEGLSEQVERRAELRELLADVRELPEEPRAALLLAEAAGMSHAEVASVLGCETGAVKGLVFRARTGLIERRSARETPCIEIREQLATLRGGALRRNELRHHLRHCPGCTAYREEVRRQRQMMAVAFPVVPSMGLKSSVLGAVGISGGAAGGGAVAGSIGSAAIAKVAIAGVVAGGGVVATDAVVERAAQSPPPRVAPAPAEPGARGESVAGERSGALGPPAASGREHGERVSAERSHGRRGAERSAARSRGHGDARSKAKAVPPGQARAEDGRRLGAGKRAEKGDPSTGRARSLERRAEPPKAAPKPDDAGPAPRAEPKTQRSAPAPATEPRLEPVPATPTLPKPEKAKSK
jgi:RNA polymerase sigma factor (sigma-70 family)